jgi:hypothetical protein
MEAARQAEWWQLGSGGSLGAVQRQWRQHHGKQSIVNLAVAAAVWRWQRRWQRGSSTAAVQRWQQQWRRWRWWQPWPWRLLNSGNSGALTVTVVETMASVVVVAMADGDGNSDGGQNKVSGGSNCDSG